MTLRERIESLRLDECFQIMDEYQELQETGVIGESLIRTIADEQDSNDIFTVTMVSMITAEVLALEYMNMVRGER